MVSRVVLEKNRKCKESKDRRVAYVHLLVLFKAQLGEPFLEILIFFLHLFHLFRQKPALKSPKPALKWAKPALKRPNRHLEKKKKSKKIETGT